MTNTQAGRQANTPPTVPALFPGLLTALLVAALTGCQSETEGTAAAPGRDSLDNLADWHGATLATEQWSVGSQDGPEYEVLGRIAGVTFVGAGLAIGDSYSNRIHRYDSSGQHTMSVGGTGGGPGEFRSVGSLGVLPDGTLAALDAGGGVEFFDEQGDPRNSIRFPGNPMELCLLDSTLVVLGTLSGSDHPLHRYNLPVGGWASFGGTDVSSGTEDPRQRSLLYQSALGKVACAYERIIYAKSSDGTVVAVAKDGTELWRVQIPSFVALVHEDVGGAGIYNGPPAGATHTDWFATVVALGQTVAVQIERTHLRHPARGPGAPPVGTMAGSSLPPEVSLLTVFLDLTSGDLLGKDDSLPRLVAVRDDRVAVARESPVPQVAVYSLVRR